MAISELRDIEEIKAELAIKAIEEAYEMVRALANTEKPSYDNKTAKLIKPQLSAMVDLVKTLRRDFYKS